MTNAGPLHGGEGQKRMPSPLRRHPGADDSPVRATFSMRLRLPEHAAVLDAAATADRLVLATTEPDEAESLWLAVDLDGARLAELLRRHPR